MFRNVALKIVSYSQIFRNDYMKIKIKWHVGSGSLMDFQGMVFQVFAAGSSG